MVGGTGQLNKVGAWLAGTYRALNVKEPAAVLGKTVLDCGGTEVEGRNGMDSVHVSKVWTFPRKAQLTYPPLSQFHVWVCQSPVSDEARHVATVLRVSSYQSIGPVGSPCRPASGTL